MINGFFKVVQDDVTLLSNAFMDKLPKTRANEVKITTAALRVFAALGMAFAAYQGFIALTLGLGLVKVAAAAGLFTVSHDLFVYLMNKEKDLTSTVLAGGRGLLADISDLWNGTKDDQSAPRHPHTEGTFLRPIWDAVLARQ